jgi:GAF domain-containing protein
MSDEITLVTVLERFAATMATTFATADVLYELGDSTVAVLGAGGAGVSVANKHGQLMFVTATSEDVIKVERTQEETQDGPCVEAFTTGETIAVNQIADLDRWPRYQLVAKESGFQAVVGLPLHSGDQKIGSLDVYHNEPREWTDDELRTARVLADIATTYIVHAGELSKARELSDQLQHALDARVLIEQAKGMLAHKHSMSVDQAFEMLRDHSRNNRISLRQVADAVVNLGLEIPRRDT